MQRDEFAIRRAITLLEHHGYMVRRPSEAALPVVLEVVPTKHPFHIGVRADCTLNGQTACFGTTYPVEGVLDPDDAGYREEEVPRHIANELAHHLAQAMLPALVEQAKAKFEPLVPEKPMSLTEIVEFLAFALGTSRDRVERTAPVKQPRVQLMEGHRRI